MSIVNSPAIRLPEIEVSGIAARVVEDVEVAEAPALGELVMDEVERPPRLTLASIRIGVRVPIALRRALRLRTVNPSSL